MTKQQVPTVQDAVTEPVPPRAGIIAESGENYLETILIIKERNEDNQYEIKQKNNCFDINDYYNYTTGIYA